MSSALPCGMPSMTSNMHDVAELLEADEVGERAADLAGADQRNLITRHGGETLDLLQPRDAAACGLSSLLYCSNTGPYLTALVYIIPAELSSQVQSRFAIERYRDVLRRT